MTRYEPYCDCLGGHVSMLPDPNGQWCRADEGWQDISTAPKDRPILVWKPTLFGGHVGIAKFDTDEHANSPRPYWRSREAYIGKTEDRSNPPTHWMPLPAKPSPTEADHA